MLYLVFLNLLSCMHKDFHVNLMLFIHVSFKVISNLRINVFLKHLKRAPFKMSFCSFNPMHS